MSSPSSPHTRTFTHLHPHPHTHAYPHRCIYPTHTYTYTYHMPHTTHHIHIHKHTFFTYPSHIYACDRVSKQYFCGDGRVGQVSEKRTEMDRNGQKKNEIQTHRHFMIARNGRLERERYIYRDRERLIQLTPSRSQLCIHFKKCTNALRASRHHTHGRWATEISRVFRYTISEYFKNHLFSSHPLVYMQSYLYICLVIHLHIFI